jgi:uncharacterized delta-60 repeat protein
VPSAPGSLDTTFGSGGIVTTEFGGYDSAEAVAVQPDGKIVAAGHGGSGLGGGTGDFALARYNSDGSLDTSFGSGGKVTTSFPLGGIYAPSASVAGIAIQSNGKIVVAGRAQVKHGNGKNAAIDYDFALARYNSNGSLDTSFGSGGKVTTNFAGDDYGNALAIQADGRLVVAGYATPSGRRFALARYNTNGSLDTTFDGDGKLTTNMGSTGIGYANAVVIQPDGRIIAGGGVSGEEEFGLARYMPNGSLDASFGVGGKVVTLFPVTVGEQGHDGQVNSLALAPNGQIVAAGWVNRDLYPDGSAEHGFAVARYNIDGSLDNAFGNAGTVTTDVDNYGTGNSVAIQMDGKIVVAGGANHNNGDGTFTGEAALTRYNSDGSLDVSFGVDGIVVTSALSGARAVVLQPSDGSIVIAGGIGDDLGVARFYA